MPSPNVVAPAPSRAAPVLALGLRANAAQFALLMLINAFASPGTMGGREFILKAYETAVREHYRFFSYGDATLIL